jgi:trans-aconitate methyltransferase
VLDLGCGPGEFAAFITAAIPGLRYTGLDFSAVAVEQARARVRRAIFLQEDLTIGNNINAMPYDTVIALEVLEHVDDDLAVLARLRSKARFVGSVPNFDAFGHVRHFRDAEAVKARYGGHISNLQVEPFHLDGHAILFLMSGVVA